MTMPPPPELAMLTPVRAAAVAASLSPAAAWYFADEWLAIDSRLSPPAAIWLAGSQRLNVTDLQLSPLRAQRAGRSLSLALSPALASNPTFINSDTLRFFAEQPLTLRGDWRSAESQSGDKSGDAGDSDPTFVIRTMWPQAWRVQPSAALRGGDPLAWLPRSDAATSQSFACHTLWQRQDAQPAATRWCIGVMLNGAQGDDDEAHGGHFALVVGAMANDGGIADLLVANFYNPDVVSEKGILPALVPLDDYLHELNAGQQHYRPSWLVLVELDSPTVSTALYPMLNSVLQQLYDHRLHYNHVANNCTGLSMDALRATGVRVPLRGPSSRWLAPLAALQQGYLLRSVRAARDGWRYLLAEQTRLLPCQAFVASVQHLMALMTGASKPATAIEADLRQHTQAIYGLQLPQLPSARARGREPALSLVDYQSRVPASRSDWQIIPVPPRTLPASLRARSHAKT